MCKCQRYTSLYTVYNFIFGAALLAFVIIIYYRGGRSRGEYSPKITEPEANNCFSIFTHSSEYKKQLSIFVY